MSLPAAIPPLRVCAYTASSAVGRGRGALLAALRERRSGLRLNDFTAAALPTWIGRVAGLETEALPPAFAEWECRNNRLAWVGLQQDDFIPAVDAARKRYGADRVALVLGTSTASIGATEEGYRQVESDGRFPAQLRRAIVHTPHSLVDFVQQALQIEGPCMTVATACSSSAKAYAQGERLIRAGLADAVVVGGVDTLCDSVLFGFASLELTSPDPCQPFDVARRGISIGEAAGFALLAREDGVGPFLLGYGESSDAHHMSAPHPEGLGARLAMRDALARGGLSADAVDYVNLHGTATPKNDEVEAAAVAALFPTRTLASSTKGWTGHTLGAAGSIEAVVALLAIEHGMAPGTLNTTALDPNCGAQIRIENTEQPLRVSLSNSFGFGGNNCALLFGREAA